MHFAFQPTTWEKCIFSEVQPCGVYLPLGLVNLIPSLASPPACNFLLAAHFSFFIMFNELLLVMLSDIFLGFRYLVNKTFPLGWYRYCPLLQQLLDLDVLSI